MAETSFKDIIIKFEEFTTNHKQLNEYGWGEVFNISTKDITFPYLHVLPLQSKKNGSLQTQQFEIYVMDLEKQDNTNLLDIMNQMFMIGNDVISEFEFDADRFGFEVDERNINVYPFTGTYDDNTAGWKWVMDITYMQTNNCSTYPKK